MAGFALLSCGDGIIKSTVDEWPASAVAALRYVFGLGGVALAVLLVEGRGALAVPRPWLQAARGAAVATTSFAFFMAIRSMPLAEATSIQFTSPMLTALLSVPLLGERAPRSAWIATGAAFVGVLIVLRPEVGRLGWAVGWPLLAALGMALLMIANRRAAGVASPLAMQYLIALFAAPILIALAAAGHVTGGEAMRVSMPDWSVISRCALVGGSATMAHLLIYMATVRASAAVVAPTIYVQLLTALAVGALAFGDRPEPVALLGALVIIGSGVYFWRSQQPRRTLPAA
ncbi:DMT family transporter [Sphingomonas baiyangensis]|uniref:DMT family transporter n=2 Tax=Sphingomonas baiyangensis TaxID=2572576 RepID=A0A4U1L6L0_9SPHN|nr:DMT family transporter [Sphingomonas baiyangensis]